MKQAVQSSASCAHCGLPVQGDQDYPSFCCSGCRAVYSLINKLGLNDFYRYQQCEVNYQPHPAQLSTESYSIFDSEEFLRRYASSESDEALKVEFAVPAMHCAACVWLLEKLPDLLPGVVESRAIFRSATIVVRYRPTIVRGSEIAKLLNSLGYPPQPIQPGVIRPEQQERLALIRLGVAAASASNTMLFAVSMYQGWFTGIEDKYLTYFNWVSLLVTLPVMFFSAVPFYRTCIGAIRTGTIHIDLPITAAIIAAFIISFWNTVVTTGVVYYDTITLLVFLLLGSRYLQRRALTESKLSQSLLSSVLPIRARKVDSAQNWRSGSASSHEVLSDSVVSGELLEVRGGEIIPADGVLVAGDSTLSLAILTGESEPVSVMPGANLFAGTQNLSESILLRAERAGAMTRIGSLLEGIELDSEKKTPLAELTTIASVYFVQAILALAMLSTIVWSYLEGFERAIEIALSILVVSCPCALGLAVPLLMAIAVRGAAQNGIFIRSAEALERLSLVREIFLDKTGTLTEGKATVIEVIIAPDFSENEIAKVVFELERDSLHVIGRAIRRWAERHISVAELPLIKQREERRGYGVEGVSEEGTLYRLGSVRFVSPRSFTNLIPTRHSSAILEINSKEAALFIVGDNTRTGAKEVLKELKSKGYSITLLSGDSLQVCRVVGTELGITDIRAELTPEQKRDAVANTLEHVAMVGDGANDAAALRQASVGIGVSGGMEIALRVADIFLTKFSLQKLKYLLEESRRTRRMIFAALLVSVVYNSIGAGLAVFGLVNPLVAAILMPLSSLSIVLIASFSSLFSRDRFNLQSPERLEE